MNLKYNSVTWQYTMTTHYWSDFILSRDLITELDLPNFERFPLKNICDGCGMQTGDAYSYGTWSRPFGTCICSTCWDQPLFRTCHDFSDSALRTSFGTFSVCACHIRRNHYASNILFSLANQVRRFILNKFKCKSVVWGKFSAKDHWRGFSTRNAHMVHIVNLIRLKMVYASQ